MAIFYNLMYKFDEIDNKWLKVSPLFIFFFSLAVHPDRITIATGQVAGTSKDGKVSDPFADIQLLLFCKK